MFSVQCGYRLARRRSGSAGTLTEGKLVGSAVACCTSPSVKGATVGLGMLSGHWKLREGESRRGTKQRCKREKRKPPYAVQRRATRIGGLAPRAGGTSRYKQQQQAHASRDGTIPGPTTSTTKYSERMCSADNRTAWRGQYGFQKERGMGTHNGITCQDANSMHIRPDWPWEPRCYWSLRGSGLEPERRLAG